MIKDRSPLRFLQYLSKENFYSQLNPDTRICPPVNLGTVTNYWLLNNLVPRHYTNVFEPVFVPGVNPGRPKFCTAIAPARIEICVINAKTARVTFANAQTRVLQPVPATVPSLQNTCFCLPTVQLYHTITNPTIVAVYAKFILQLEGYSLPKQFLNFLTKCN